MVGETSEDHTCWYAHLTQKRKEWGLEFARDSKSFNKPRLYVKEFWKDPSVFARLN
jgi:hypothetical protein